MHCLWLLFWSLNCQPYNFFEQFANSSRFVCVSFTKVNEWVSFEKNEWAANEQTQNNNKEMSISNKVLHRDQIMETSLSLLKINCLNKKEPDSFFCFFILHVTDTTQKSHSQLE